MKPTIRCPAILGAPPPTPGWERDSSKGGGVSRQRAQCAHSLRDGAEVGGGPPNIHGERASPHRPHLLSRTPRAPLSLGRPAPGFPQHSSQQSRHVTKTPTASLAGTKGVTVTMGIPGDTTLQRGQ